MEATFEFVPATKEDEQSVGAGAAFGRRFLRVISSVETNSWPRWGWRWSHQFANRIKDDPKLGVVLLLQLSEMAGQFDVRGEELPESDERPHDLDVDQDSSLAT